MKEQISILRPTIYNTRHKTIQPDEHQAIEMAESKSPSRLAPQNVELLPKDKDLRLKARPRAKQAGEPSPHQHETIDHCA